LAVVGLGTNLATFRSTSIFIFSSISFFFVVKVGFEVFIAFVQSILRLLLVHSTKADPSRAHFLNFLTAIA
jgi:hypothetical protein